MAKTLITTVGGSADPIVTSIKSSKPGFVYFLTSDDMAGGKGSYTEVDAAGKATREGKPSIVAQTGLRPEQYEIIRIKALDDVVACRDAVATAIQQARSKDPDGTIIVDYTGGTKSMGAGAVLAAVEDGECQISFIKGERQDLVKVNPSTSLPYRSTVWDMHVQQKMGELRNLVAVYDYSGALRVLDYLLNNNTLRSEQLRETLEHWVLACRLFNAWDRFDLDEAYRLLQSRGKDFGDYAMSLKESIRACENLTQPQAPVRWVIVWNMLLNAERCATQQRYDDAAARLYRAIELVGQIALTYMEPHSLSSTLSLQNLPTELQQEFAGRAEKGEVKLDLTSSWKVLSTLPKAKTVLDKHGKILLNDLPKRNKSILAHGFEPISESAYLEMRNHVQNYARDMETALSNGKSCENLVKQFPICF